MNSWGIPAELEDEIKNRDLACVYCGVKMVEKMSLGGSRKIVATWEHIINDARIVTRENIARCCVSCNSSKGNRILSVWLESRYCKTRGISSDSVAKIIKTALQAESSCPVLK